MKKIILAVVAVAMAVALPATAAKKDKKKVQAPVVPAVTLTSGSDSLSYACGYQQTNGLVNFLLQQKMDTAYMADFIRGMKEFIEKSEDPSFVAYSLGLNIAGQLNDRMIPGLGKELEGTKDSLNKAMFYEGFFASLKNDTTFFKLNDAEKFFRERLEKNQAEKKEAMYGKNREDGKAWLAANAKKEGVVSLPSGLQYKVLVEGTGVKPASASEEVTVKYEGKLIDGTVFDSSYKRSEQTNKFRANQVISGWTEALQLMPVGSTWELYIPYDLAYGDREAGKIPPYSTLIFKVELVDCDSAQAAAKAAEEAEAAAKVAKKPAKKTSKKK